MYENYRPLIVTTWQTEWRGLYDRADEKYFLELDVGGTDFMGKKSKIHINRLGLFAIRMFGRVGTLCR